MNTRRDTPGYCPVRGAWWCIGPFGRVVMYPEDAAINVRLTWDDAGMYDVRFFPVAYGELYRFRGRRLPAAAEEWTEMRYVPPLELELTIVRLAARGVRFRDIRRCVDRPRWELAAILNWHHYPGLCHARHGDMEGWE